MFIHQWRLSIVALCTAFLLGVTSNTNAQDRDDWGGDYRDQDDVVVEPPRTITEVLATHGSFSTLLDVVQRADLDDTLMADGPYTLFAPTNDAFALIPEPTLERIVNDENLLDEILKYHIVRGKGDFDRVIRRDVVSTIQGANLEIVEYGVSVQVSGAQIVRNDIAASNGIIHAIDKVMLPPTAINQLEVSESVDERETSIIDVVHEADRFQRFSDLLDRANLEERFDVEGPYTIFAPTNDAIDKLNHETVDELQRDTQQLRNFVLYHFVPGRVSGEELGARGSVRTLEGRRAYIGEQNEGGLTVGGADVIQADLSAANGVVHAIDDVMVPGRGVATQVEEMEN